MKTHLSKTEIVSFCGNVLPLYLKSDKDLSSEEIKWHIDADCVSVRSFDKNEEFCFNHGILLTLIKEGEGKIICEYDGQKYECKITVKKLRHADSGDTMNVYPADLHIHTSKEHEHNAFANRKSGFHYQCIESVKKSGAVECSVLTDHASTTNNKDFFRGFVDDEEFNHDGLIVFPGAESQVTIMEEDRFGITHKNSGETVTINACRYSDSSSWEEHYAKLADSPFVIGSIAHPSVVGWDENGVWNYSLYKYATHPEFKRIMRLIETGRGDYSESSMLYHYTYSQALDCGLKISPCSTTDCHGEYIPSPGKTFIVSPEKSKEMFFDAFMSNRIYSCDSGAVNLLMNVNGHVMGETLPNCDTYNFHIEASLFKDVDNAMPVKCNVISDYGEKLLSIPFNGTADFEIKSDTARYFYIILIDCEGRKTWSSPFWTGREFDDFSHLDKLKPIDKSSFNAINLNDNSNANIIINNNPLEPWCANEKTASIMIDMKTEKTIAALGHYAPSVHRFELEKQGISIESLVTEFVADYRISTSCDGKTFCEIMKGNIREFGGEYIIPFKPHKARYVKFEVLATVGADCERRQYTDANVKIAELSLFEI